MKEKVIFENVEAAKNLLRSIDINPLRAWNNSTPYPGVRQLHVGVYKPEELEKVATVSDKVQIRRCSYPSYPTAVWVNVYFYARRYVRKDTKLKDYQLASDGYYLQKDFD